MWKIMYKASTWQGVRSLATGLLCTPISRMRGCFDKTENEKVRVAITNVDKLERNTNHNACILVSP